jgi:DNA-binding MarR family transcriptional regulator
LSELKPLVEPILNAPGFLMWRMLRDATRPTDDPLGHPRLFQCGVAALIYQFGPQSQKQIADALRKDPSEVVSYLDELERLSVVRRERDSNDRRRNVVNLTASGADWFEVTAREIMDYEEWILRNLTPEENADFRRLLKKAAGPVTPSS